MQDAMRTYLELAMGLTEASRKTVRKTVKDLVGKGGATAEQARALTGELLSMNSANREALAKLVRFEVDRALGRVGLATAEEVKELTARLREAEAKLAARGDQKGTVANRAGAGSTAARSNSAKSTTAKRAPAKKTTGKKTTAKKTAAKKTTAKRAPGKKTAVKKTAAATRSTATTTVTARTATPAKRSTTAKRSTPTKRTTGTTAGARTATSRRAPATTAAGAGQAQA